MISKDYLPLDIKGHSDGILNCKQRDLNFLQEYGITRFLPWLQAQRTLQTERTRVCRLFDGNTKDFQGNILPFLSIG